MVDYSISYSPRSAVGMSQIRALNYLFQLAVSERGGHALESPSPARRQLQYASGGSRGNDEYSPQAANDTGGTFSNI